MSFYSSISTYYDEIFPVDAGEMTFVKKTLEGRKSVLDIGCGTGNKSVFLAESGRKIVAFDGDPDMIKAAQKDHPAPGLEYLTLDMAKLGESFSPQSFDAVLCLGNTLVHLPAPEKISALLGSIHKLIKPGGLAIIQILNYDRILDKRQYDLPLLDTDSISFKRFYEFKDCGMNFVTRLSIKKTGQEIKNSIPLYPLRKRELDSMLTDAGFAGADHYGSYKGEPLKPESFPLIAVARKG